MSCYLNILGKDLDVDRFIDKAKIPVSKKWYKGEPINRVSKRINQVSGISFETSGADFDDIKTQIHETIEFLNRHKANLEHIVSTPEIEYATVDFGVDSIIGEDHLTQGFYFPIALLKICAELGIGIELSLYNGDMQVILERNQLKKISDTK